MPARCLLYTGKVQGVGFRYSIKQLASGFDVVGWVRNLSDGRVEMWVQGEKAELESMEKAVLESHLKGFIREVEAKDRERDERLKNFEITA